MATYRVLVAYDGAPFKGFARQPDQITVQGTLEDALSKILSSEIKISGAGRTDAGVHALGQVVSFTTEKAFESEDLLRRLNSICGPEIAVLELERVADGFDARFSAASRTYEYAILTREIHDPFSRHTAWHHPRPLDTQAMSKAASQLLGEHDFSSFGRVEPPKSPVRRIEAIEVEVEGDLLIVRVTANSFLQQMVRSIVGTLIAVGEGTIDPDRMGEVLETRNRSAAGPVAPPHGLFLVSVDYPEELL